MATNHSNIMDDQITEEENTKSKRPKETKFKQQNLPAWQPILTASTVFPAFLAIGVAFIPLGVGLLVSSNNVKEHIIDYTNCLMTNGSETCADFFKTNNNTGKTCHCTYENVTLSTKFEKSVYIYYGLTNFYQNHRRYVRSRDDDQLHGDSKSPGSLIDDCDPYKTVSINGTTYGYAPCGAIANSLFNDSFTIKYLDDDVDVGLIRTGIAWVSDKSVKFNNPQSWTNFVPPPNWKKNVTELDPEDPNNNGYENEDLIVWMRTAALPTFRKLYRRVNHTIPPFSDGLPSGSYKIEITYNYPVTAFDGTKSIIISTTSWLGGKNSFLGIAYIVVGSLCIILFLVFFLIHLKWGKKILENLEDDRYFSQYYLGNTLFSLCQYPPIVCDSLTKIGTGLQCIMSKSGEKDESMVPILSPSNHAEIEKPQRLPSNVIGLNGRLKTQRSFIKNNRGMQGHASAVKVNYAYAAGHTVTSNYDGNYKNIFPPPETYSPMSGQSELLLPVSNTVSQTKRTESRSTVSSSLASLHRKASFMRAHSPGSNVAGFSGSFMAQKLRELKVNQDRKEDHMWMGGGRLACIWESQDKQVELLGCSESESPEKISMTSSVTTHTSADSWVSRGIQVNLHKKTGKKRSRSNKVGSMDVPSDGQCTALSEDVSCSLLSVKKVSRERMECWIPHNESSIGSHSLRPSQSSLYLPTPEEPTARSGFQSEDELIGLPDSHLSPKAFEHIRLLQHDRRDDLVAYDNISNENQNKQAMILQNFKDMIQIEDLEEKSNSNNNLCSFTTLHTTNADLRSVRSQKDLGSMMTINSELNWNLIENAPFSNFDVNTARELLSSTGLEINYRDKQIYEDLVHKALLDNDQWDGRRNDKWIITISVAVQTDELEEY